MKCTEYQAYSVLCQGCDIHTDVKCTKIFNFDVKLESVRQERRDMLSVVWNACPTCGSSIGYHPKNEEFRCQKCGQRITFKKLTEVNHVINKSNL